MRVAVAVHREHLLYEGVVLAVAEVGAVDLLVVGGAREIAARPPLCRLRTQLLQR